MPALAVAVLSAALLAYEILLVRLFSIAHFHHFASLAIGLAMLGFGAAGTLRALWPRKAPQVGIAATSGLSALLLLAAPALSSRLPLDAAQLPWDPRQWWRLGAFCLVLAAPLVAGALAILGALAAAPARPGLIYGASFAGSGLGALAAIASLAWLPLDGALAVPAALAAIATLAAGAGTTALPGARHEQRGPAAALAAPPTSLAAPPATRRRRGPVLAAILVLLGALAVARPPWRVAMNPYKGLPQVEAFPGARRVGERWGPLGWTVAVSAPSFRHAPGLSLGYRGPVPPQTALFVDGDLVGAVADWSDTAGAMLDALPTALPYALGGRERVLVLGSGGNTEIWNAARHGARRIVAVDLNPHVIAFSRAPAPPAADVVWMEADARAFVAATRETFDLVVLPPGGGLGASAAGLHALGESFLHTVEGYRAYLERLSPGGVLAVTCWLTTPPRESVRLVLAAAEALRRVPGRGAAGGLLVSRSWGTVTVLVKPSGFEPAEIEALERWAQARLFDLDWTPRIAAGRAARPSFHALDRPALLEAARAAAAGPDSAAAFARRYPFAVAPATDARPYPQHFLRAGALPRFLGGDLGRWLPFAEWGYVTLVATLAVSAALGAALLLAPWALGRGRARSRPRAAVIGYFAAIGLAYLFAEIAALQPLGLLLGHPLYAVAALLALVLVCSGVGSALSDRIAVHHSWRMPAMLALGIAAAAAALLPAAQALQGAPLLGRAGLAAAALAPLAVLMGMPFPLGLRGLIGDHPDGLAWAWAANGFASVVAAPLAALVALELRTSTVLALAAVAYAGAAAVLRGRVVESPPLSRGPRKE
jgi:spermidine synthase